MFSDRLLRCFFVQIAYKITNIFRNTDITFGSILVLFFCLFRVVILYFSETNFETKQVSPLLSCSSSLYMNFNLVLPCTIHCTSTTVYDTQSRYMTVVFIWLLGEPKTRFELIRKRKRFGFWIDRNIGDIRWRLTHP